MNTATFAAHARLFIQHVVQGELGEASAILQRHPELIHDRNSVRETPLHWLAIENELAGVRLLAKAGAAVDCADHAGSTVLCHCAGLGLIEICRLLLDRGADPHQRSSFCWNPPCMLRRAILRSRR